MSREVSSTRLPELSRRMRERRFGVSVLISMHREMDNRVGEYHVRYIQQRRTEFADVIGRPNRSTFRENADHKPLRKATFGNRCRLVRQGSVFIKVKRSLAEIVGMPQHDLGGDVAEPQHLLAEAIAAMRVARAASCIRIANASAPSATSRRKSRSRASVNLLSRLQQARNRPTVICGGRWSPIASAPVTGIMLSPVKSPWFSLYDHSIS